MAENDSAADNGADGASRKVATPRRELLRLRADQATQGQEVRGRLEEAVLIASGELGYRNVTVHEVLARCGANRVQFYREFANKDACYAAAYGVAIERVCGAALAAAAAQPGWRTGLRAALAVLARDVAERPVWARGVLVEVHVAGGPAMEKRLEVIERLTRAIDSARRENESRHSPPPITAAFMVSAIEESVAMALVKGEPQRFAAALPQLAYLAVGPYFGDEAAREELALGD